jgi:hypothetical protein
VDGRNGWVKRAKDVIAAHLSDKPDATAAEQAIIRRAADTRFALAEGADPETLDTYARVAGNMRRMLEALGLERRSCTANFGELYLAALRRVNSKEKTITGSAPEEARKQS